MAEQRHEHIDAVTGTATTGHEWDGMRELNTPLPRWWLWMFYATIVWSIGYWIVYPSWPLLSGYSKGVFGWQSRNVVVNDLAGLRAIRGPMADKLADGSAAADRQRRTIARASRVRRRAPIFNENCAACHGEGGGGAKGYPNLNDDDWLWGGKLDDIVTTIRHGVRSTDDKTPAWQHAGVRPRRHDEARRDRDRRRLRAFDRRTCRSSRRPTLAAGKKIFADTCASCHGDDRQGQARAGRAEPDRRHLALRLGQKRRSSTACRNGRAGVMPAWAARLDDSTIKALAVYVHSLGGGEK